MKLRFTLLFLAAAFAASAQIPQGMNYQAVARDAAGEILPNQTVRVQFNLRDGSPVGPIEYSEQHAPTTNQFGVFTLTIGAGTVTSGTFSAITWDGNQKYLETLLDPAGGTNFVNLGTAQLLSVPYAFYAGTIATGAGDGWGTEVASTDVTLIGDGTSANPLGIAQNGATTDQVLTWNGANWAPADAQTDNWGTQVVQTGVTIAGNGTPGMQLDIAQQAATLGQTLKWDGTKWAPGNDDVALGGTLTTTGEIAGNGTPGSPLALAGQGAANGQVLAWNGTQWAPATPSVGKVYAGLDPITVNNTTDEISLKVGAGLSVAGGTGELGVATTGGDLSGPHTNATVARLQTRPVSNAAPANNQVLTWNGTQWAPADAQTGPVYTPGNGISLVGNQISNTAWTVAGGNATRTGGTVGIGTATPLTVTKLDAFTGLRHAGFFETNLNDPNATAVVGRYGGTTQVNAAGILGESLPADGWGIGGEFLGGSTGVTAQGIGGNYTGGYSIVGVSGEAFATTSSGNTSTIGVFGKAYGSSDFNYGVFGAHDTSGFFNNYAGYFEEYAYVDGDFEVNGFLVKAGGTFKIDHPQDPANKFLVHSFVESPDMMNVYNGNAVTDASGTAVVTLPDYFETLNRDFRYQLTAVGQPAQLWVAEEISGNTFVVKSDQPNVKVSWQVTGVRQDPWAEANRVMPVVEKSDKEQGRYLHPELYGQPKAKAIHQGPKLPQQTHRKPLDYRRAETLGEDTRPGRPSANEGNSGSTGRASSPGTG